METPVTLRKDLYQLVVEWEILHKPKTFPLFDRHVSDCPHTLVLLQDPGPSADAKEWAAILNQDDTAWELKRLALLVHAEENLQHVLVWNTIPWRRSGGAITLGELNEAKPFHAELIALLRPHLKRILLMGDAAHRLLPFLSGITPGVAIRGGHHTGRKARQSFRVEENEALFHAL